MGLAGWPGAGDGRAVATHALRVDRLWGGGCAKPSEAHRWRLSWSTDGLVFSVEAPWHEDPAPPGAPGVLDGLWDYEVSELFIASSSGRYVEVEVGPWGHQLVLAFSEPRQRQADPLRLDWLEVIRSGDRWRARGCVGRSLIPDGADRAAAFAMRGVAPRRHLTSCPLPGPTPDFHQPHSFPRWSPEFKRPE